MKKKERDVPAVCNTCHSVCNTCHLKIVGELLLRATRKLIFEAEKNNDWRKLEYSLSNFLEYSKGLIDGLERADKANYES